MKLIIRILFWGVLFTPMCVLAQNETEQRDYEIRVAWEELQGYAEYISYKVPIYYDDDDNVIKHGAFKINFKKDLTARAGSKCIITYKVSGNYVNGKLDGVLSVEQMTIAKGMTYKTKGTLNFVNGDPAGILTFSETGTVGDKSETITCSVTIKDYEVVSYNDGEIDFNIDNDGKISGTIDGIVCKNNIVTNEFYRKTGESTKPNETVQNLINACVAGTMSKSDLIAKGFLLKSIKAISHAHFDKLERYFWRLEINGFEDNDAISAYKIEPIARKLEKNRIYILKRVNVISTEELLAKANVIKNADRVDEYNNVIRWSDTNNIKYSYEYNTNCISISDDYYYFTDEAKQKLEEIVKEWQIEQERIAEEKRMEQERIAEEKRMEKIRPICDYLVSKKTALSISFSEEANLYFDPTGLSSTWQLDLQKEIKPFCKIVDCKVYSCETKDNIIVAAVLDITKYNKKGNITYRVPVTIVKGKILVTSIDFSNAIVVE